MSLTQGTDKAGEMTDYNFRIVTINSVPKGGAIKIVYPTSTVIPDTVSCYSQQNLDISIDCSSHDKATRTIII